MTKFLRRTSNRYSKLGMRRKKKQIWRRPTGRHNKMREKRKGYPTIVSIGYRTKKNSRWKIKGKKPIIIMNIKDLEKIGKENIAIIGKVGKKRKIEIAKALKENKIGAVNINTEKFLNENKKEDKEIKKITSEEAKKIIEKDKEKKK